MENKNTILFVDDEKIILDSLKSQLRRHFGARFNYESALDADEAWELINELDSENVIIIVSDWLMPGVRGDEFLIQVHETYPNVIKIMLTGQADHEAISRAFREAAMHTCLSKPWSEEELVGVLEKALAEKKG